MARSVDQEINDLLQSGQVTEVVDNKFGKAVRNVDQDPMDVGDQFEIKAGFVDGGVLDQAGVEALAATPSKEVLIAKMMGSLMSSLYGFAYVLQAKIDKENGGEAAEAPAEA